MTYTADTPREAENARMRHASGAVRDNRPLVRFLYQLLREGMPFGEVERLADAACLDRPKGGVVFTNGWAARHAQDLADRLTARAAATREPGIIIPHGIDPSASDGESEG